MPRPTQPLVDRMRKYLRERPSGCIEWTGVRLPRGYGRITVGGRPPRGREWLVHRLVWTAKHGPIPDGMDVCHHCDNPSCCRPDHLFLGTRTDNMRDAVGKGRMRRGATIPWHVLDEDDVRWLRAQREAGRTYQSLADELGCSYTAVYQCVNRVTWTHIDG